MEYTDAKDDDCDGDQNHANTSMLLFKSNGGGGRRRVGACGAGGVSSSSSSLWSEILITNMKNSDPYNQNNTFIDVLNVLGSTIVAASAVDVSSALAATHCCLQEDGADDETFAKSPTGRSIRIIHKQTGWW